ncbi:MAG: hypothetical protein IH851_08075 [Armatimonadetes bacterium]|nr:hypothetical protein [Armatimonadota bacterium]
MILTTLGAGIVASLLTILFNWRLAAIQRRWQTEVKYEERLIVKRVKASEQLLGLLQELERHLAPVAKGTRALERPERSPIYGQDELQESEFEKTQQLIGDILEFCEQQSLYFEKPVYLLVTFFTCALDELRFELADNRKSSEQMYALCHIVWKMRDSIQGGIQNGLKTAKFQLATTIEIQAARKTGHDFTRKLRERIASNRGPYSIDARNKEIENLISSSRELKSFLPYEPDAPGALNE